MEQSSTENQNFSTQQSVSNRSHIKTTQGTFNASPHKCPDKHNHLHLVLHYYIIHRFVKIVFARHRQTKLSQKI